MIRIEATHQTSTQLLDVDHIHKKKNISTQAGLFPSTVGSRSI